MKKFLLTCIILLAGAMAFAQAKPKQKEKAPTQKDIKDMMKEAQQMMNEMSLEDKKMMDSLGIKMPSIKTVSKVANKQLAEAWEDESRIVPKKDAARIAAITKGLTDARMGAYITSIQNKTAVLLTSALVSIGNQTFSYIKSNSKNSTEAGNMAAGLWAAGNTDLALYTMGKIAAEDPKNTGNISNYASMLSMQGAQHLAIPILINLNAKFPKNSTLLNNLGQAWFGLGDIDKAEKYLDSTIRICAYHPQANLTKSLIQESKGDKAGAIVSVKKAIKNSYSKEKEDRLRKLGEKLKFGDLSLPFKPSADPLGLNSFRRPAYPKSVSESKWLKVQWDQFMDDCKQKIEQLEKQLKETEETYGAKLEKMPALIMQAVNTGGNLPMQEPLFATKAGLVLKEREKFYEIKLKELGNKTQANLNDLNKIEKARKRCVPEAPCTCFLNADNDYIRSYNERKQESDEEALTFFKNFSNDLAYWSQYSSTDEIQYKIIALGFTIDWLKKLTEYIPVFADREYDCSDEEKAKPYKLPEWDFTANCKYNVDINFFIVKQQINCSHSSTTYDLGPVKYTARELGTKYIGGTLILSPKASVGGEAGPLTVEAFIGADITIDLDENKDIKDWDSKVTVGMETGIGISKGPVKFGASVTNAIELEIDGSGLKDVILVTAVKAEAGIEAPKSDGKTTMDEHINEGVGLINKGIGELQTSVKIGMEDRVSLISGHGSESNIGLGGVTISL